MDSAPATVEVGEPGQMSRRDALRLGAVAGVALGFPRLPPALRAAANSTPPPGGVEEIRHVVLFMQENRSFDHYFGTLRGVQGFGDRAALRARGGGTIFEQPAPDGSVVLPFGIRGAAGRQLRDIQYINSLAHTWDDAQGAWAGGWNDGWIEHKSAGTMAGYDRADLPFHFELAETFTICDAYFCSLPGGTSPNRNYFVSGHSGFEPGTQRRAVDNAAYDPGHPGYEWPTYAEQLEAAGVSWKVYQEWDNFEDNNLDFYAPFEAVAAEVLAKVDGGPFPTVQLFYASLPPLAEDEQQRRLDQLDLVVAALTPQSRSLFDRALRRGRPGTLARSIADDIAAGSLPAVSYVVAPAAQSEHPQVSSPAQGARLAYDVLEAIASNPETWAHTAVFVTYDENDGYFDHVAPPVPPPDATDEYEGDRPMGLGPRVPMIVVSPWTVGGHVCSEVFDHTSMTQFLEAWSGVTTDQISNWRRRVCGDLTSAFDFSSPATPPAPAAPGEVPPAGERWVAEPPPFQALPGQEPGTRPARALQYQPDASATLGDDLDITLANSGARCAHLTVYDWHERTTEPIHVDVDAAGEAAVALPIGDDYDITVTGPNRFRRDFAGSRRQVGAFVGVRSHVSAASPAPDRRSRTLAIAVANGGDEAVECSVDFLAYRGAAPERHRVEPGDEVTVEIATDDADGWYDVELTVAGDDGFRRRLTGHIEDGWPSISG